MQAFPAQVKPVRVNAVVVKQKSPESGEFWVVLGWTRYHADAPRMRPNRRVSRGDRGGVRRWRGVVLVYNFLLEGKTYIRIRRAFHWQEPSDARIHVSQ